MLKFPQGPIKVIKKDRINVIGGEEKKDKKKYKAINPRDRKRLQEYFAPYNQELYDLIGEEYDWDK